MTDRNTIQIGLIKKANILLILMEVNELGRAKLDSGAQTMSPSNPTFV